MNLQTPRARPRRTSVATEEDRAWVSFYQRVRTDAALAAEVLMQLESDVEMRREHLALYLCCRESLRLHQAREERNRRIGRFVRGLLGGLFVRLPKALRQAMGRGGDIAVACLPETPAEPATAKVRRLAADPKVLAAREAFKATPASGTPASDTLPVTASSAPSAARAGG
jgi:hypothetical protein